MPLVSADAGRPTPVAGLIETIEMGFLDKKLPSSTESGLRIPVQRANHLADGALDTLSCVLRTMGEAAFPTDKDSDPDAFLHDCAAYARHVEHGAAVPSADIRQSDDGERDWQQVRRFFVDRRHNERDFVTQRLTAYRGLVDDLVARLRDIGDRDDATESSIVQCLKDVHDVVTGADLPEAKDAVEAAIVRINETFAEQRLAYERQIEELNARLSSVRQDLVQAREEMQRDSLTDVFNRGAFDQALEQSINMHFLSNQPVTLALIDLDHFKQINDTCGHSVGDAVLKAVAENLSRTFIRKSDFVSRFGGDEFAVILNDTSAANTAPLLERFLASLRGIDVTAAGVVPVGCSIGYTEITAGDGARSLIERADSGLYQAKADGRNRAAFVPPSIPA